MRAKRIIIYFCIAMVLVTSCNISFDEMFFGESQHICKLHFNGSIETYNTEPQTRGAMSIPDGMLLYIVFNNDGLNVTGFAVYHASVGEWSLTYNGVLAPGTFSCDVLYFEESASSTSDKVTFSTSCPIYSSKSGTYTVLSDGSVTVSAKLEPQLYRVRFRGAIGTNITISKIRTIESYNIKDGEFVESQKDVALTVGPNGFTPYLYYIGSSFSTIVLSNDANSFSISSPLNEDCKSGFLDIPTRDNHYGWALLEHSANDASDYNGHEYVDLGLSVMWATKNLGALTPEGFGYYYMWGEVSPISKYDWSMYKYCNGTAKTLTKYCTDDKFGVVDNKVLLDLSDDAARMNWGGMWRMPTEDEMMELCTKCTCTWISQNGVFGMKFTGPNGKSIFLPAAGECMGYSYDPSYGSYLTSSLYTRWPDYAYVLGIGNNRYGDYSHWWSRNSRDFGYTIRPVCKSSYTGEVVEQPQNFVSDIDLGTTSLTMGILETTQIKAEVFPSNATNTTLVWISDNSEIASVDNLGNVYSSGVEGIANVTVIATDGSGVKASCTIKVKAPPKTNGHEYVDLGLSVMWATCNLGAASPEEYGGRYAWGEVAAYEEYPIPYPNDYSCARNPNYDVNAIKTTYNWDTYKWGTSSTNLFKYTTTDGQYTLSPEDDAAQYNWGGDWRMPTSAEFDELLSKCDVKILYSYGKCRLSITAKNGNSIILPGGGYCPSVGGVVLVSQSGFYWSSSLDLSDPSRAYRLDFASIYQTQYVNRNYGHCVRPVIDVK